MRAYRMPKRIAVYYVCGQCGREAELRQSGFLIRLDLLLASVWFVVLYRALDNAPSALHAALLLALSMMVGAASVLTVRLMGRMTNRYVPVESERGP
jgi:hypothetical protein